MPVRRHLTFANIASATALVVAVTGVGGLAVADQDIGLGKALAKDSVRSKQIKNRTVKTVDLKDGAITGRQVANGSLGGADIDEASLGQVPAASTAVSSGVAADSGDVLRAVVRSNGTLVVERSEGAIASTGSNGANVVTFDRDVSMCTYAVQVGGLTDDTFVHHASAAPTSSGVSMVRVGLYRNDNHAFEGAPFNLLVVC
ncbi:hypothetical protein [Nocardioides dilutus]